MAAAMTSDKFRYTGVGEFRDGKGDSGGFTPDGETGLAYSGFADTVVTTFASETTFHTTTAVPTRTFSYPMGSMTYTMPGWSSWSKSRWATASEATYDAQAIAWRRYSPTESSSGSYSEEGEDATERFTWLWQHSYTGPAGHLFEQNFGGTTTTTHTSATTGAPPTDPAVLAAMNAIANQSVGESAAGGHGPVYSTTGQGVGGSGGDGGDGVVAAKDLNLAEFFAQAATEPTWQSAGQSASKFAGQIAGQFARQIVGQSAGEGGSSVSDEPSDLPARHPDSAMPESWLDVLDALKDRAKTAYDHPDQLPALTDAALAELTAMDDPENPGTPIVQTCAMTEGGEGGGTGGGGSANYQAWFQSDAYRVWYVQLLRSQTAAYGGAGPNGAAPAARDWVDQVDGFFAGWADTMTFGVSTWIRGRIYRDIATRNHQGAMFHVGQGVGMAHSIAIGGAAGWSSAGLRGPGREFSHWFPARMGGARSLWNGNYVPRAVHALSDPYRYRFMPRAWKASNPMPSVVSQQWTRIPYAYKGVAGGGLYGGASVIRSSLWGPWQP